MTSCPCCSNLMVRHIRSQQQHWFCRTCWQEMPALDSCRLSAMTPALERSFQVGEPAYRSLRSSKAFARL